MERSCEQLIAELEILATVIGTQAERVAKMASVVACDSHRLELWAIAMDLEDESDTAGKHARVLWHGGTRAGHNFAECK